MTDHLLLVRLAETCEPCAIKYLEYCETSYRIGGAVAVAAFMAIATISVTLIWCWRRNSIR